MRTPSRQELVAVARLRSGVRLFLARSDRITKANGLSSRQYELLAMLHAFEGPATATELAKLLQLTRNSTTELINRAERAGLVRRAEAPDDRRQKHIVATEAGSRAFVAAFHGLAAERERLAAILTDIGTNT